MHDTLSNGVLLKLELPEFTEKTSIEERIYQCYIATPAYLKKMFENYKFTTYEFVEQVIKDLKWQHTAYCNWNEVKSYTDEQIKEAERRWLEISDDMEKFFNFRYESLSTP